MKKGIIKYGEEPISPRVVRDSIYPDIDSTYTTRTYYGDRLDINTKQVTYGIKPWSNMVSGFQGMAIYRNYLFRMHTASETPHSVYRISDSGALTEVGSFICSTSGHSNAMQFAPTIEGNNAFPYLYVSNTDGSCVVLNIASDYTATQVQKITVTDGWQVQIGDDGYIWAIAGGGSTQIRFIRYRKVPISEGENIALTSNDILEEIRTEESFDPSTYTFQGSKFKFGKAWLPIGTDGAGKSRALFVYDLAARRTVANINLTDYMNKEFEDCDFWDNALIIACYESNTFILRF